MSMGASPSELLVAGAQNGIVSLNLNTGSIMREVSWALVVEAGLAGPKLFTRRSPDLWEP